MQPEDLHIAGEGPLLDCVADQQGPVVHIILHGDGGRNGGGQSLTSVRSHFIVVGIGGVFAVKAPPVSDSGPITPVNDIFAAPSASTGHG